MDTQPIDRLRELLNVAEGGELGELGQWLAPRLNDYLARASEGATLDEALGLAAGRGEAPWYTKAAMTERNDAIRELANQHFDNLDLTGQADAILQAIRRYRGGRWRFDREKDNIPEGYVGTPDELLYEALRRGGGDVPESKKHLLRILSVS